MTLATLLSIRDRSLTDEEQRAVMKLARQQRYRLRHGSEPYAKRREREGRRSKSEAARQRARDEAGRFM